MIRTTARVAVLLLSSFPSRAEGPRDPRWIAHRDHLQRQFAGRFRPNLLLAARSSGALHFFRPPRHRFRRAAALMTAQVCVSLQVLESVQ